MEAEWSIIDHNWTINHLRLAIVPRLYLSTDAHEHGWHDN